MSLFPVLCVMGPTGAGKSALAFELARRFQTEIVSVDSAMVYRGMDIGTAKPSREELAEIPHHLIDIRDPIEPYSAGEFRQDAWAAIQSIRAKNKLPILVGGTMLYFKVLQQGLSPLPKAQQSVREKIAQEAQTFGWDVLYERLKAIDPKAALRIHPNDPQRLQRALEVYEITGHSMTALQQQSPPEEMRSVRWINIAINFDDRSVLHQRIADRFEGMLQAGLVEEVELLYRRGDLNPDLPSIRSVGYRQVWRYLSGECSYGEMKEQAIIATRQLAKRQLTWLRAWSPVTWFDAAQMEIDKVILGLKKQAVCCHCEER